MFCAPISSSTLHYLTYLHPESADSVAEDGIDNVASTTEANGGQRSSPMSRRQRHAFISPGSNFSTSVPENAVRSLDEEIGRARKALTGVRGPKSTGQLRTGRAGIQASSKGLLLLEGLQAMEGHLRKSVMELRYSDDDHAEAEKVLCEMVDSNHFRIYRVVGEGMGEVLMYESALQDMSAGLSVSRWGRTCLQVTLLNIGSNSRPAPLSSGSIPISRGMSVTDLSNRTSSLTPHDRIKRAKGRRMSVNVELSVSGTSYGNKVNRLGVCADESVL